MHKAKHIGRPTDFFACHFEIFNKTLIGLREFQRMLFDGLAARFFALSLFSEIFILCSKSNLSSQKQEM